jgi:hypothetical protein
MPAPDTKNDRPKVKSTGTAALLWVLAVVITLTCVAYQRRTGPTYPVRGAAEIAGTAIAYRLERSHGGPGGQPILLRVPDPGVQGEIRWRRYPMGRVWQTLPLIREGERLSAELPHQPPAGKLEYSVILKKGALEVTIPPDGKAVVTRFKGAVPLPVLLTHIILMFSAMLVSNRAGLEALRKHGPNLRKYATTATLLLFAGGMIMGPIVQKFAFGEFWTGLPFGTDLTDNKTLIAFVFWILALVMGRRGKPARGWVLLAALVTLAVYLIPHSLFGSELKT